MDGIFADYTKRKIMKHLWLVAIFIAITTSFPHNNNNIVREYEKPVTVKKNRDALTKENVFYWLKRYDVDYTSIAFRQTWLETGNYKSNICIENNNLFGMRLPRVRKTTAIGENRNHAVYTHWKESVKDYKLYQEYYKNKIRKCKGYYDFLTKAGYSTTKSYVRILKSM